MMRSAMSGENFSSTISRNSVNTTPFMAGPPEVHVAISLSYGLQAGRTAYRGEASRLLAFVGPTRPTWPRHRARWQRLRSTHFTFELLPVTLGGCPHTFSAETYHDNERSAYGDYALDGCLCS